VQRNASIRARFNRFEGNEGINSLAIRPEAQIAEFEVPAGTAAFTYDFAPLEEMTRRMLNRNQQTGLNPRGANAASYRLNPSASAPAKLEPAKLTMPFVTKPRRSRVAPSRLSSRLPAAAAPSAKAAPPGLQRPRA